MTNSNDNQNPNQIDNKINETDKISNKNILDDNNKYPPVGFFKLQFTLADKIDVLFFLLSIVGAMGMGVVFPLFSILFGDSISGFGNAAPSDMLGIIEKLVIKLIWVSLGMLASTWLNVTFANLLGERYIKKLKLEYFRSLLRQEQGFFDQRNAYEFSTKVQYQLKIIQTGVGSKTSNFIMSISMFIAAYIVGFITSWKLSLILMSIVPFMTISGYLMIKALMESQTKSRTYFEKAGGIAEEILYNIKTVASFANFKYEKKRFNDLIDESFQKAKYGGILTSIAKAFVFFLIFGAYAIAIGVGAKFIEDKEVNKSDGTVFQIGDVLTVIFTIVFGAFSLGQAAPNLKAIAAACEASKEFFYIYERKPDIDLSNSNQKPERENIKGNINFKNVTFAYPSKKERKILQNLNINFEAGCSTAIVGETGSGKSTIINLVERLYDCQEGTIEIDGINIKNIDLKYFRSLIGYVPQEPILFNISIKENIIFGRENVTDEEIQEACSKACVNEFLNRLEQGIETKVGVKGSKLSGGQKQRIAIARAILKKPKLLFLDEATSALDNKSEKYVKKALDIVSKEVTTIIIAHRLSTVRNADRIIVLSNGNIVEIGNHKTLFEAKGSYYNLVKSQESNEDDEKNENEEEENMNDRVLSEQNLLTKKVLVENKKLEDLNLNDLKEINEDLLTFEQKKKKYELEVIQEEKDMKEAKKLLWPIMFEKIGTLLLATFMACISGITWPAYGLLLAEAIFRLSDNPLQPKPKGQILDDGIFLAGMFLIIAGAAGIANFFVGNLFSIMGEFLAKSMRVKCFEKFLSVQMSYYDISENNPGTLLTKLASDTLKINGIALSMFAVLLETLITLLVGLILSLIFSWQLSLLCLGFVPFIILASAMNLRIQKGLNASDEVKEKELGNILSECVVNTKSIYCFNMEYKAVEIYNSLIQTDDKTRTIVLTGFVSGIGQFLTLIVYAVIFYVGSVLIDQGDISFKNMFRSIFSILMAAFGVGMADQYIGDMNEAKKALLSLYKVLSVKSEINPDIEGKYIPKRNEFKGEIEFKNVSFAYPTRQNTLIYKDLSFKISPGEQCAFVGFSGSGKSTIVQLILRFYDVLSGEILIDGVNIKEYDIVNLRHMMGLVMQEPVLFKMNVYNNIQYGNFDEGEEKILSCAKKSKVPRIEQITKENKDALPVSGGEKQRIAIARCMLRDPKILLLDEATSALDKNVEEEVQKSLDELMKDRTTIVIAHRLSTIVNCTKIFLLERGKIIEEGSHSELMEKKGKYYSLYMSGQKN